jgi:hypothetical protein
LAPARLDAAARQLRMALLKISLPLASAARVFTTCRGWNEFGYARLSDHARERLGRSARWVRDRAALSETTDRFPGLAAALTGEDGGRPIGVVAALHIGKVASPDSLNAWISIARTYSVRTLKAFTHRATAAGSCWPEPEQQRAAGDHQKNCASGPPDDDEHNRPDNDDRNRRVYLSVPPPTHEAFAETLDLYRTVEGHAAPTGEFVDSLIAEATSGSLSGKIELQIHSDGEIDPAVRSGGEVNNDVPLPDPWAFRKSDFHHKSRHDFRMRPFGSSCVCRMTSNAGWLRL